MRKTILLLSLVFASIFCRAQKVELSAQAYSGLFSYSGTSAASTTTMKQVWYNGPESYAINPYGNHNAFSYGGNVQGQMVSKTGFIWGLQLGYDILKSRININNYQLTPNPNQVILFNIFTYNNPNLPATGHIVLQRQLINVSPYAGCRIGLKKLSLDVLPGLDMGFNLASYSYGKAVLTNNNNTVASNQSVNNKLNNAPVDFRPKLGIAGNYKKWTLSISYAYGLTNDAANFVNPDGLVNHVHDELYKLGVGYKIL